MSLDEGVSQLIQRIYCAGEDPQAWDSIAEEVLKRSGAIAGLTTLADLENREFSSSRFYGPNNSAFAKGMEEYAFTYPDDPSLIWGSRNPKARYCDSRDTLPAETYLTNDYIKWNRAHFGSTHWFVGFTPPDHQLSFSFSIHFPAEQGPGDDGSLSLFRLLFDHMECAVRLHRRPFHSESQRALFLLDGGGSVREMSSGAQTLLRRSGPIGMVNHRLVTTCRAEQRLLDEAIGDALNIVAKGTASRAVQLTPPRGPPSIVVIKPLLSSYGPFGQVRCELLIEVHQGLPRIGRIDLMQSLYDLTAREMQVIRLLADGHTLETLADSMAISLNTAKTHLRAIFVKTGTNKQAELLRLCAGLSEPE